MIPAAPHTACLRSAIITNTFYLLLLALWSCFLRLQYVRRAGAALLLKWQECEQGKQFRGVGVLWY